MKVPVICCDSFGANCNGNCNQHGWCCTDNLMYLEANEETYVYIPMDHDNKLSKHHGIRQTITHCPFCGTKIEFKEEDD